MGNARYLSFPEGVWDKLNDAQRWAVNRQFLDDAIARGDSFRLASLPEKATADTFFLREFDYLVEHGYKIVGEWMIR
jgi:hypothetical protein